MSRESEEAPARVRAVSSLHDPSRGSKLSQVLQEVVQRGRYGQHRSPVFVHDLTIWGPETQAAGSNRAEIVSEGREDGNHRLRKK